MILALISIYHIILLYIKYSLLSRCVIINYHTHLTEQHKMQAPTLLFNFLELCISNNVEQSTSGVYQVVI